MTPSPERLQATPGTLDSWATTLGFLSEGIAHGIEQMSRRLDLVMSTEGPRTVGDDEPNGYGGISRRGDLGRLLLSDWALADIEPDEFLRRFATAELSYLEVEREAPRATTAIAVLVDLGPEQLGARRLVQLAGLATLDRRARSLGIPLLLGVLGDPKCSWHTGELPELFAIWLRSRTTTNPQADDLSRWSADLAEDASAWLFGATNLEPSNISSRWRRLSAVESSWSVDGATHLSATVENRIVELPLPEPNDALRLLRGHGLRRERAGSGEAVGTVRFPMMPGSARRLMGRGDGTRQLLTVVIPQDGGRRTGQIKRHSFNGDVLAATFVGSRTIALVSNAGRLTVSIVGKKLAQVGTIDIASESLGLPDAVIANICSNGLNPLYFNKGELVVQLEDHWWALSPSKARSLQPLAAAAASTTGDQARLIERAADGLQHDRSGRSSKPGPSERVILGPRDGILIERTPGVWHHPTDDAEPLRVAPTTTVHGITSRNGQPTLVTQSHSGHILRLVGPNMDTTTLTEWSSDDVVGVVTHPTLSLIALERDNGIIDVLDVAGIPERLIKIDPKR